MIHTLARFVTLAAAMAMLLVTTGCATVVTGRGPDQTVRINSIPRGAQVYINGEAYGTTPTTATLSRQDDHHVRLELDGYRTYERYLETNWNPWMLGNIPIFFPIGTIIGVIIDIQSDADRWLRPDRISVNLVPENLDEPAPAETRAAHEQPQDPEPAVTEVQPVPDPERAPPEDRDR